MTSVPAECRDPRRRLLRLAWPLLAVSFAPALYAVADTAFLGRGAPDHLAALHFALPLLLALVAVAGALVAGVSPRVAMLMAAGDAGAAARTAGQGLLLAVAAGGAVAALAMPWAPALARLLGASGEVALLCAGYLVIAAAASTLLLALLVLAGVYTGLGDTRTPALVLTLTLLLNAALDGAFILGLGLGVRGAALASAAAHGAGVLLLLLLLRSRTGLPLTPASLRPDRRELSALLAVALPAALAGQVMVLYVALLNRLVGSFSAGHVAALGLCNMAQAALIQPFLALGLASEAVVGGLRSGPDTGQVGRFARPLLGWTALAAGAAAAALGLAAPHALSLLSHQQDLLELAVPYLRIDVVTLAASSVLAVAGRLITSLGRGMPGLLITTARVFVFAMPAGYLAVHHLGGGFLTVAAIMAAGACLAAAAAVIWLLALLGRDGGSAPGA